MRDLVESEAISRYPPNIKIFKGSLVEGKYLLLLLSLILSLLSLVYLSMT